MNFKRFFSFALAFFLLSTRIGFALNVHYCGAEISVISFANDPLTCGMEVNHKEKKSEHTKFSKFSCCEDQVLLFQNQEHQQQETGFVPSIFLGNFPYDEKIPSVHQKFFNREKNSSQWNPPPPQKIKFYIFLHALVVYA